MAISIKFSEEVEKWHFKSFDIYQYNGTSTDSLQNIFKFTTLVKFGKDWNIDEIYIKWYPGYHLAREKKPNNAKDIEKKIEKTIAKWYNLDHK